MFHNFVVFLFVFPLFFSFISAIVLLKNLVWGISTELRPVCQSFGSSCFSFFVFFLSLFRVFSSEIRCSSPIRFCLFGLEHRGVLCSVGTLHPRQFKFSRSFGGSQSESSGQACSDWLLPRLSLFVLSLFLCAGFFRAAFRGLEKCKYLLKKGQP